MREVKAEDNLQNLNSLRFSKHTKFQLIILFIRRGYSTPLITMASVASDSAEFTRATSGSM